MLKTSLIDSASQRRLVVEGKLVAPNANPPSHKEFNSSYVTAVLRSQKHDQPDPHLLSTANSTRASTRSLSFPNSGENYMSHFEPGTEFTVGVEAGDPLLSIVRERDFTIRLGQLSTRYVSRRHAQEN